MTEEENKEAPEAPEENHEISGVKEAPSDDVLEDPVLSSKRLSAADWAYIRDQYERGVKNGVTLAAEFGVSKSAVSQHLKKHGVFFGTKSSTTPATSAASPTPATETFADKRQSRIEKTREETYEWIRAVQQQAMKILVDAKASGRGIAAIAETKAAMTAMRNLLIIQKEGGEGRLTMLEADKHIDEVQLPQIIIEDLGEEEIAAMRARDEDEESEDVVIEGDDEEIVVTE